MYDPVFTLSDHDDELARHCTVGVELPTLTVHLHWEEEPEDDDLDDDELGFEHEEAVVFDDLDQVEAFLADLLRGLVERGYGLFLDGHPADVRPGLADLSMLADKYGTPWRIQGNVQRARATLPALERAYDQPLPESIRAFFAGPRWRRWDRARALDLPGDPIGRRHLGCPRPVWLDLLGPSLLTGADLYRVTGLVPFAKFVGQPEGLDYYGVVQVDAAGRIWLTTRDEVPVPIAADVEGLCRLLDPPSRIASLA